MTDCADHLHTTPPDGHSQEDWEGLVEASRALDFGSPDTLPNRPPRPEIEGVVYFIGGDDGPVKIGFTTTLEKRLRRLHASSPVPLKLLASKPARRSMSASITWNFVTAGFTVNGSSELIAFSRKSKDSQHDTQRGVCPLL